MRAVCPQPRILLMSGIFPGEAETVIDQGLTPVVWEPWQLDLLEAAAAARGMPAGSVCGSPGDRHRHVAAGRARGRNRGLPEAAALLPRFHPGSCLRLEGVMTHFLRPGDDVFTIRPIRSWQAWQRRSN